MACALQVVCSGRVLKLTNSSLWFADVQGNRAWAGPRRHAQPSLRRNHFLAILASRFLTLQVALRRSMYIDPHVSAAQQSANRSYRQAPQQYDTCSSTLLSCSLPFIAPTDASPSLCGAEATPLPSVSEGAPFIPQPMHPVSAPLCIAYDIAASHIMRGLLPASRRPSMQLHNRGSKDNSCQQARLGPASPRCVSAPPTGFPMVREQRIGPSSLNLRPPHSDSCASCEHALADRHTCTPAHLHTWPVPAPVPARALHCTARPYGASNHPPVPPVLISTPTVPLSAARLERTH